MTQYSAFGTHGNNATGPASSTSYSGPWVAGLSFSVTQSGYYLQQFGYWRADSSQSAAPSFALWTQASQTTGTYQAGTLTAMSGAVAGQWNYVSLATPFLLATGTVYKIVVGYSAGNFSETHSQFDTGGPYVGGIVNGPLNVYSAPIGDGGTNAIPLSNAFQGSFGTGGTDPSATFPSSDDSSANFWIDLVIGPAASSAPTGAATPGPAWKRRFQPWRRAVQQVLPVPTVTISGSVALAPMAMPGKAVVYDGFVPAAQPGPAWRRAFQPWRRAAGRRVQPAPVVTVSGTVALAPMALSGSAVVSFSAAAAPAAMPGQAWRRVFQPWRKAVQAQASPIPATTVSGSVALAPMAMSGNVVVSWPSAAPATPGPAWRRVFQPWRRAVQGQASPIPTVTVSGSVALAPMAMSGSTVVSLPTQLPAQPGPAWRRAFQPWRRAAGTRVQPAPVIQVSGSIALAPMAIQGSTLVSWPATSPATPGPAWRRVFQPWRRAVQGQASPIPTVTISGSMAMAPMAPSGNVAILSSFSPLAAAPGKAWQRRFQAWRRAVQAQQEPPPVVTVTVSGSVAMAPMGLSGSVAVFWPATSPAAPGRAWLQRFQPWRRAVQGQASPIPATIVSGSMALAPMAASGSVVVSYVAAAPAAPGRAWLQRFQPWRRAAGLRVQPAPVIQVSGSLTLAPMAMSGTATVITPAAAPLAAQPGPAWKRRFQRRTHVPEPPQPQTQTTRDRRGFLIFFP